MHRAGRQGQYSSPRRPPLPLLLHRLLKRPLNISLTPGPLPDHPEFHPQLGQCEWPTQRLRFSALSQWAIGIARGVGLPEPEVYSSGNAQFKVPRLTTVRFKVHPGLSDADEEAPWAGRTADAFVERAACLWALTHPEWSVRMGSHSP